MPDDVEYLNMFNEGLDWGKENQEYKHEVSVNSNNLKLYGEYFNFGFDKAVIIIAGRMESCFYSYYFAKPYKEAGYNVLVIDNRAHGFSDGKIACLGCKEYKDILEWGKLLNTKFSINNIVIHGICIGAATGVYVLTDKNCPIYFKALISEGMYTTFYHSFINHMILDKRPIFPFAYGTMFWIWIFTGKNPYTFGPVKFIKKLNKPVLFMHSKKDEFSHADVSGKMYDKCNAPKTVVWFEKGAHSRIRPTFKEQYDNTIVSFLNKL